MLTDGELAELQALDESTMTDTATISRPTRASDNAGGQTLTYATVATVACRLLRTGTRPGDGVTAGRQQVATDTPLHFPTGTDVRNADRITVGTRTFEVVSPQDHTWQTSLRVLAVEVT